MLRLKVLNLLRNLKLCCCERSCLSSLKLKSIYLELYETKSSYVELMRELCLGSCLHLRLLNDILCFLITHGRVY
jgi:hypothetical protein